MTLYKKGAHGGEGMTIEVEFFEDGLRRASDWFWTVGAQPAAPFRGYSYYWAQHATPLRS